MLYDHVARSAGNKKFVSATAVADFGNAQALFVAPTNVFSAGVGVAVQNVSLGNRSGGLVTAGLAVRLGNTVWTAGQVTAAGVYTADTADAQDATTGDFSLHDRADSGSGFLVSADIRFNILGLVQSAAGDQTTPVKLLEYWDGTSWIDLLSGTGFNNVFINDALTATGEQVLCWGIPNDWVVGGSGTGVPSGKYNLRVLRTHSGAGTANPVASQLFVGVAKMLNEELGDNAFATISPGMDYPFPPQGVALHAVFSTANQGNYVEADVRPQY